MKSPQQVPDATRARILTSAWSAISDTGNIDISMSEVARRSGVSRQTMYLAFESRAGLLSAMVAHKDLESPLVQKLGAAREACDGSSTSVLEYVRVWLDYLPDIYPVGSLLSAASISDTAAVDAWQSRMTRLRRGFADIFRKAEMAGNLNAAYTPQEAADIAYSLTHVEALRILVVECGWSPERFTETRLTAIVTTLLRKAA